MLKNLKIFLIVCILVWPLWMWISWLEKEVENFFYWREISKDPQLLIGQIFPELKVESLKPFRNWEIENLEIGAKSAISVLVDSRGKKKILYQKNIGEELAIASLTKMMSTLIVLENYDLSQKIEISEKASRQPGDRNPLPIGRIFSVKYLLYPLLIESSNVAAFALSNDYQGMSEKKFTELMNLKAKELNLQNTHFVNASGLDPLKAEPNFSTAIDLVNLTKELLKYPLIWEISSLKQYSLYGPELINTNELLGDESVDWRTEIIGGKTGFTEKAGGCLLLVLKAPEDSGYLINIILGSENRFGEMKKIINWLNQAYIW